MSLLGKAALFALREVARPALRALGQNVGVAIGRRAARRIDPEGFEESDEDEDCDLEDDEDEDEVELDDPDPEPIDEDERTMPIRLTPKEDASE